MEPLHRAGPEILDKHVALAGERKAGVAPLRGVQVERDGALVAIEADERRPRIAREGWSPQAGLVTDPGHLELDDVGA
jgi:hypothetical protein